MWNDRSSEIPEAWLGFILGQGLVGRERNKLYKLVSVPTGTNGRARTGRKPKHKQNNAQFSLF